MNSSILHGVRFVLPPVESVWVYILLALPAPCGPIWENVTSFTKSEVHNITIPPVEDRDTATSNVHRKFREVWLCCFWDMLADRQTHRSSYVLITILCSHTEEESKVKTWWCRRIVGNKSSLDTYNLLSVSAVKWRASGKYECQDDIHGRRGKFWVSLFNYHSVYATKNGYVLL